MGIDNPIGKWVEWGSDFRVTIIGVIKDFNFEHLSDDVSPMSIFLNTDRCRYMFIKINEKNTTQTVSAIEEIWNSVFPTYPFVHSMLADSFKEMYSREEQTGNLFKYFAILAIIISCLGLFGLASYMAEQKTKEIGVRKVLGASESSIIFIMSKEFIIWVIIANMIAWPVTWYFGKQFLDEYANSTDLSFTIFIMAGIASFIITFLTISFQAVKASRSNPVDALRYE